MVPKINGLGRSFAGVAAYCLHDAPEPDDRSPETSERVAWTDTRNLPTIRAERAARLMAATAKAAPDLKRLAGGARGGRKLAKPVLHYSLSWAQDETPTRQEMSRAVDGSLEALGLEGHEALIVAHDDTRHPHVHVVANRVDPETGKAAKLGNSKLRLSRWAEGYEREQGRIPLREAGQEQRAAAVGRGGGSHLVGAAASLGAPPPRGDAARAGAAGDGAGRRGAGRHDGLAACRSAALGEGRGPALAGVLAAGEPGADGMGRAAQAAGGHAAEARPGEPHPARPAPDLADRAFVARAGRGSPGPGRASRGLARGSRPAPQRRAGRTGQGTRRQRPAHRAGGKGGLPKGAAGRGAARTADRCRAGGAGDEGARPEHNPHSPPAAPAPRPRAWRGRVRAMTLMLASRCDTAIQ